MPIYASEPSAYEPIDAGRVAVRTESVGTKVTPQRKDVYERAAKGKPLSEWVREVLDREVERAPLEQRMEKRLDRLHVVIVSLLGEWSVGTMTPGKAREYLKRLLAEDE